MTPRERQQHITPIVWQLLAAQEDTPGFWLKLIALINVCPTTIGFILEQPQWLTHLNQPHHWYDMYTALYSMAFPLNPTSLFVSFLQTQGDAAAPMLERLRNNTYIFETNYGLP